MNTTTTQARSGGVRRWLRAESPTDLKSEKGAVGTEMAIVVAIVVAIAIALGAAMTTSATNHQACIRATPDATLPANCT